MNCWVGRKQEDRRQKSEGRIRRKHAGAAGRQQVSRSISLAKSTRIRAEGLLSDERLPEAGTLLSDVPDAARCGFCSGQYCRRIPPPRQDRQGSTYEPRRSLSGREPLLSNSGSRSGVRRNRRIVPCGRRGQPLTGGGKMRGCLFFSSFFFFFFVRACRYIFSP